MRYDLENFDPPVKQPLPFLRYDVSLYCAELCKQIKVWPEYLKDYSEKAISYAAQRKKYRPKKSAIPPEIRIYIFDHRLFLLFAALDSTGDIATFMSKFCAQYRRHDIERHCYGDGSKIGECYPCKTADGFSFEPNWEELYQFEQDFGFVPLEDFAHPVVVIFQGDKLVEYRRTTMQHCVLLMEKYHSKNLVDLKAILKEIRRSDQI